MAITKKYHTCLSGNGGMSRELCKLCYHVNAIGFQVPDDIWRAVVPYTFRSSIVCLACFARMADERCVPWDKDIEFFPVSFATHIEGDQ